MNYSAGAVQLGWKGLPLALYGGLCGHGRYYMRPLGILIIIVIVGAVPIRAHFGGGVNSLRPLPITALEEGLRSQLRQHVWHTRYSQGPR